MKCHQYRTNTVVNSRMACRSGGGPDPFRAPAEVNPNPDTLLTTGKLQQALAALNAAIHMAPRETIGPPPSTLPNGGSRYQYFNNNGNNFSLGNNFNSGQCARANSISSFSDLRQSRSTSQYSNSRNNNGLHDFYGETNRYPSPSVDQWNYTAGGACGGPEDIKPENRTIKNVSQFQSGRKYSQSTSSNEDLPLPSSDNDLFYSAYVDTSVMAVNHSDNLSQLKDLSHQADFQHTGPRLDTSYFSETVGYQNGIIGAAAMAELCSPGQISSGSDYPSQSVNLSLFSDNNVIGNRRLSSSDDQGVLHLIPESSELFPNPIKDSTAPPSASGMGINFITETVPRCSDKKSVSGVHDYNPTPYQLPYSQSSVNPTGALREPRDNSSRYSSPLFSSDSQADTLWNDGNQTSPPVNDFNYTEALKQMSICGTSSVLSPQYDNTLNGATPIGFDANNIDGSCGQPTTPQFTWQTQQNTPQKPYSIYNDYKAEGAVGGVALPLSLTPHSAVNSMGGITPRTNRDNAMGNLFPNRDIPKKCLFDNDASLQMYSSSYLSTRIGKLSKTSVAPGNQAFSPVGQQNIGMHNLGLCHICNVNRVIKCTLCWQIVCQKCPHRCKNYPSQMPNMQVPLCPPVQYKNTYQKTMSPGNEAFRNAHLHSGNRQPTVNYGRKHFCEIPEKCLRHTSYCNRFANSQYDLGCCVVCLMPDITRDGVLQFKKVIRFDAIIDSDYSTLVNKFREVVEQLPMLINRPLPKKICPFVGDETEEHYIFKLVDAQYQMHVNNNFEYVTELNQLIMDTNDGIKKVSNIKTTDAFRTFRATVDSCKLSLDKMMEEVKMFGPQLINVNKPTCGEASKSFFDGPLSSGNAIVNQESLLYIVIKDMDGNTSMYKNVVEVKIRNIHRANGESEEIIFAPYKPLIGVYEVKFTPTQTGTYQIKACVNNCLITGSPLEVVVEECGKYNTIYEPILVAKDVPSNGSDNSYTTRPKLPYRHKDKPCTDNLTFKRLWGVSLTSDKHLLVCERESSKIFEMDENYHVMRSIGGGDNIRFDRPAKAVEYIMDGKRCIVVCDKDHNKVQMLSWNGEFICQSGTDEVKYPWDVCISHDNDILVADSKIPRIAVLNKYLNVIHSIPLPQGTVARGIQLGFLNHLIVTDFTTHDILVVHGPTKAFDYSPGYHNPVLYRIGMKHQQVSMQMNPLKNIERKGEKNQERLQGVTVDKFGNILVADSRRSQVRVVSYLGDHVGEWHSRYGQPMNIALKGNQIIVTTLDESTVCVYERDN